MSKQIHYVVCYYNETGTFSIDMETTNAVFDGNVWDTEINEWGWIDGDNAEESEQASRSWSMLNVMIDDFKSGGDNAY